MRYFSFLRFLECTFVPWFIMTRACVLPIEIACSCVGCENEMLEMKPNSRHSGRPSSCLERNFLGRQIFLTKYIYKPSGSCASTGMGKRGHLPLWKCCKVFLCIGRYSKTLSRRLWFTHYFHNLSSANVRHWRVQAVRPYDKRQCSLNHTRQRHNRARHVIWRHATWPGNAWLSSEHPLPHNASQFDRRVYQQRMSFCLSVYGPRHYAVILYLSGK